MIGRPYGLLIESQSQSSAKTVMEFGAASDVVMLLMRAHIGQDSVDSSENTSTAIQRVTTSGTGTDSSASVAPLNPGDTAYSGTCETNSTIEPTYTANRVLAGSAWNLLSGFLWTPANDDEIITMAPSGIIGINLNVAITTANLTYGATVHEIGN